MMRLFKIVDTKNKKVIASGFENKTEAKKVRNQRNAEYQKNDFNDFLGKCRRYIVMKDEDHIRYKK